MPVVLSNASNAALVYTGPRTPIVPLSLSFTLGFISGYNISFFLLVSTARVFLLIPAHVFV